MPNAPIITFKAGRCDVDTTSTPHKIRPHPTPGYLYLYSEDDLVHLCWRARTTSLTDAELDLMMVPTDGTFKPYLTKDTPTPASDGAKCPVPGRVFTLKFSSSGERHFFWLQSREQPPGERSRFSKRDLRLGEIVDDLLQGGGGTSHEELNRLRSERRGGGGSGGAGGADEDAVMEDIARSASGGAGADATGGDVREEGEGSREGGADGGRAHAPTTTTSQPTDPDAALRQLLASIGTSSNPQSNPQSNQQATTTTTSSALAAQAQAQNTYTTLPDLLPTSLTTAHLAKVPASRLDNLLATHLPCTLLQLAHGAEPSSLPSSTSTSTSAASEETISHDDALALATALDEPQKRELLEKVLRSPQFAQSVAGVDRAVRSGGLEGVSEALGVRLDGGAKARGQQGGGGAVREFVEGVRGAVEREGDGESGKEGEGGKGGR